ncbi:MULTISPECIES: TetR/AcrR family transcriptional regulator [Paenibacillus]|jgi:AcrR family transcriptional regulator|uniref:TetR/AcrR family transcriptional regulator n=1 Tax=Paenibacillus TaxID=44249 RepID=UPI001AE7235B|nr:MULTISPECIES: TetR/AcrR family transcriptional regulator [Paenibacillus]MBP1172773.1 AcrR family transcriptional regulator [Paenibacillus sp. PvR133]URJ59436.1 TetR/AcrR family transcriptional regulator [Paenibacillus polymyxa]
MTEGGNGTSDKILAAAFKCISAKGYANVSMRDIAEEAGVVLSQLNYYFNNKEGLFKELLKSVKQEYLNNIENKLQNIDTTSEKVSFLVEYCQELIKENTDLYRLLLDFFNMAMWSTSFNKELSAFFKEVSDVIGKYIASDYSINENVQASPKLITRMVIGSIFGIAIQYILDPDDEKVLDGLNIIHAVIK